MLAVAADPLAERVRLTLDDVGMSARQLAIRAGIAPQSLHAWLNGEYSPKDDSIWQKLLALLEQERARKLGIREQASKFGALDRPRIPVGFPLVAMRYAGEVPCATEWGDPLASEEFIEVEVQFEGPRRFAAKVVGDSCYPALVQGDITIWEADPAPPYGVIVLAQQQPEQGCTVKQLTHDGQRPHLAPVNPAYGEPADGPGWSVAARLVAVLRPGAIRRTWYSEHGIRPRDLTNETDAGHLSSRSR